MTSGESLGAAGGKRPRTVYCGTPYKKPMSSSGRRLVDMTMMMIIDKCWNGSPVLVSAALVDPQRGGQTTLSASQVAVGSKQLRIVELGTPYERPMSSSGRLSVDVMMMMKVI
ncbi:jg21296 [Pararge aegeria aegeria]|uniref:Jg21296 protein n=1 Tax=Pararge aegeria aegeria TaxID=348720 RepID=A0A8S4SAH3_9NEOP|nr:jg21296 [Pararge aegeria aegeria]